MVAVFRGALLQRSLAGRIVLRRVGRRWWGEAEEPGGSASARAVGLLPGGVGDVTVGSGKGDLVQAVEFVAGVAPGVGGGVLHDLDEQQRQPAALDVGADAPLAVCGTQVAARWWRAADAASTPGTDFNDPMSPSRRPGCPGRCCARPRNAPSASILRTPCWGRQGREPPTRERVA